MIAQQDQTTIFDRIRGSWLPLHPEWTVHMIRAGEPAKPGDFQLTSLKGGEALYSSREFTHAETGSWFRYDGVTEAEIVAFLESQIEERDAQIAEAQHQARLEILDTAAQFRECDPGQKERRVILLRKVLALLDDKDFGALVSFDSQTGEVEIRQDEEDADV